ncbi:MAG: S-layer homology domain-containing protein [Clostridiales bacterium]|nr:S-layer homology domain-containing protein [Clostridiales bacterium]
MKKFLVVMLAVAMIFAFATTSMAADTQIKEFSDIADQSQAAKNAIMKLAVLGVLEGNDGIGGPFRPGDTLTRAEFAKIVCFLTGNSKLATSLESVGSQFTDVTTGNWYTGWVNAAAASGYFIGDPAGTFRPNANITMNEVATVALRCAGYNDALPGVWPAKYVTKANNIGLLDDVDFVGSVAATRADAAIICDATLGINMVAHIKNEVAYGLGLYAGEVDPDGFTEIYYISNEEDHTKKTADTILHKAFKCFESTLVFAVGKLEDTKLTDKDFEDLTAEEKEEKIKFRRFSS